MHFQSDSNASNASPEKSQFPEAAQTVEFPEGGLSGWSTVAGAFLVQFCGFGYTTSFGVYQDFYTRIYITNQSPSTISWVGSVNGFLVVSGGLLAGRLYDRGYFYHLLWGGSLLISFSVFMLSLAKPDNFYQVFLAQALGVGIGGGMMYVPSIAVVSHYFQKRRALAMTIVACGSSLGAALHPIMLNNTLNGRLGFANATRANAGVMTGCLLLACCLTRPRLPFATLQPDLRTLAWKFAKDGPYVCYVAGSTLFFLGYYFPLFYLQLDATKHGLSNNLSFYSLVILSVASFAGRLSSGFLARPAGVGNLLVGSTACCAILMFAMILLKTTASVVVIAVLFGYFAGMFIALTAPFLAILADDISELGARMGFAFAISAFGVLVGPPIDGAILTGRYTWWKPAVFSGLVSIFGFLLFVLMMVLLRRLERPEETITGSTTEAKA